MAAERKFSPALAQRLCDLVREGYTDGTACATVGISTVCLHRWLRRGDEELETLEDPAAEPETEHGQFARAYRAARAEAMRDAEARVFRDKPDFWLKAGPGRYAWSEKVELQMLAQVEHSGQVGIGVHVEAPQLTVEEMAEVLDILRDIGALPLDDEEMRRLGYIHVSKMVEAPSAHDHERSDATVSAPAPLPAPAEESEEENTAAPDAVPPMLDEGLRRSRTGGFHTLGQPPRFFAPDRDNRSA